MTAAETPPPPAIEAAFSPLVEPIIEMESSARVTFALRRGATAEDLLQAAQVLTERASRLGRGRIGVPGP